MPNDVRRAPGPAPTAKPALDEIDRKLIELLAVDGRMPNAALAAATGIAASTCLTRVRSLRERGIIRGFHAELDLARLGLPIQALVSVRLASHARDDVDRFRSAAPSLPGVLSLYHVTGSTDYLLHVAVADPDALRELVLNSVVALPEVAHAETALIFEHVRGQSPLG